MPAVHPLRRNYLRKTFSVAYVGGTEGRPYFPPMQRTFFALNKRDAQNQLAAEWFQTRLPKPGSEYNDRLSGNYPYEGMKYRLEHTDAAGKHWRLPKNFVDDGTQIQIPVTFSLENVYEPKPGEDEYNPSLLPYAPPEGDPEVAYVLTVAHIGEMPGFNPTAPVSTPADRIGWSPSGIFSDRLEEGEAGFFEFDSPYLSWGNGVVTVNGQPCMATVGIVDPDLQNTITSLADLLNPVPGVRAYNESRRFPAVTFGWRNDLAFVGGSVAMVKKHLVSVQSTCHITGPNGVVRPHEPYANNNNIPDDLFNISRNNDLSPYHRIRITRMPGGTVFFQGITPNGVLTTLGVVPPELVYDPTGPRVFRASMHNSGSEITNAILISADRHPEIWEAEYGNESVGIGAPLNPLTVRLTLSQPGESTFNFIVAPIPALEVPVFMEERFALVDAELPSVLSFMSMKQASESGYDTDYHRLRLAWVELPTLSVYGNMERADARGGGSGTVRAVLPAITARCEMRELPAEVETDFGSIQVGFPEYEDSLYMTDDPDGLHAAVNMAIGFTTEVEFDEGSDWEYANPPDTRLRIGFTFDLEVTEYFVDVDTGALSLVDSVAFGTARQDNYNSMPAINVNTGAPTTYEDINFSFIHEGSDGLYYTADIRTPQNGGGYDDTDILSDFYKDGMVYAFSTEEVTTQVIGDGSRYTTWSPSGLHDSVAQDLEYAVDFGESNFGSPLRKNLDSVWVTATTFADACGQTGNKSVMTYSTEDSQTYHYTMADHPPNYRAVLGRGVQRTHWGVIFHTYGTYDIQIHDVQFSLSTGSGRRAQGFTANCTAGVRPGQSGGDGELEN